MSKKDKNKQQKFNKPNLAGVSNNILEMDNGIKTRAFSSGLVGNPTIGDLQLNNRYRLYEKDEDKVLKAVLIPGRVKISKEGYAVVKFDDGSTAKYMISDIVLMMNDIADNHITRYNYSIGAYAAKYHNVDLVFEDVNTGNDECRSDVDKMIMDLYDTYNTDKNEGEEPRNIGIRMLYEDLIANDLVSAIYMWEQMKRFYRIVDPACSVIPCITEVEKRTLEFVDFVDKSIGHENTSYRYLCDLVTRKFGATSFISQKYSDILYNDDEVTKILTDLLSKDEIRAFMRSYGAYILERKNTIKQLINKKIFTEEELHGLIDSRTAFMCYIDCGNKELLKYLSVNDLVNLYHMKKIDINQIIKHTTLESLLNSTISKDIKMKILCSGNGERVYGKIEDDCIWELFKQEYFSIDDMKKLETLQYFNIDAIINNYNAEKRRKIAAEMGTISAISDDRILEFFTADIVLKELSADVNDERRAFYNKDLRALYEAAGRNFEQELANVIVDVDDDKKVEAYLECFKLYNEGILSINTLKSVDIPESMYIDEYNADREDRKLIEFFNAELLSQDTLLELLDEDFDEKVFTLIKKGMNARAIRGFYSTAQLIEFTKNINYAGIQIEPKLTIDNLAELKDDIITGLEKEGTVALGDKTTTLLDLYLDGTISYENLYDMKDVGIISKEEADEINDHFNLDQGVAALEKKGVSGQTLNNLFKSKPQPGPQPNPKPNPRKDTVGIDETYIVEFYKKMGANSIIKIDGNQCPVFSDYVIIPIVSKKIGFLEGDDGRTYILPLKVILEQINNPRGEMDLIGNATSRNSFNSDKRYVRSTNHTKNWIENTVKKAAEISSAMSDNDVKTFKKNNAKLIDNVRQSYEKRKNNQVIS